MGRIQSLQVLRFVAALMVAFGHAVNIGRGAHLDFGPFDADRMAGPGVAGVDIFFVISGAIMVHVSRNAQPIEFLRRRFLRVAPPYYLVTLAFVLVAPPLIGETLRADRTLTALTFWPVWWSGLTTPLIVVGWTLCFEMLFYVGFAASLWRRRAAWTLLGGFALMWVLREATGWHVARFLGNPMILEFLMGVALMRWGHHLRVGPALAGTILLAGFAAILVPAWPGFIYAHEVALYGDLALFRVMLFGLPAVAIVWATLQLEPLARGWLADRLAYLGDASYALYLTHWPLFWLVTPFVPSSWPGMPLTLVAAALAVVASALFYRWIEKPLLTMSRGWGARYSRISIANQV